MFTQYIALHFLCLCPCPILCHHFEIPWHRVWRNLS